MPVPTRKALPLCALAGAGMLALGAAAPRVSATPAAAPVSASGNAFASGATPGVNPLVASTLRRYLHAHATALFGWLADGSLLIGRQRGAHMQLERLSAPLGNREPLVRDAARAAGASPRPFGHPAFIYAVPADHGTRLMLERLGSNQGPATATALTTGAQRDGLPVWAHDGHRIAFAGDGASGSGSASGVYLLDTRTRNATPRWVAGGGTGAWRVFGWAPDDSKLLIGQLASAGEYALSLVDLATGSVAALELPRDARPRRGPPVPLLARSARFDPDGQGIVLLSDQDAPFARLLEFDPGSGTLRALVPDTDADVERFATSANGHYLAYTLNEDGISRLMVLDRQTAQSTVAGGLPSGIIRAMAFDQSGHRLAIEIESARTPGDLYVLATGTDRAVLWARGSLGAGLRRSQLPEPVLVHFPTWDALPDGQRRQLSAFVYGPAQHPGAPHPVLIFLRTGGGVQYRPGYDPLIDYLVDRLGYVVVAPNVRGASGYGADFEALGDGVQRGYVVRDVGALLVWIGLQRELDAHHIAIMGESYGAYVALLSLVDYGNQLLGGVVALPAQLPPLENGAGISRPLLLLRGQGGARVSAGQFRQQLAELRAEAVAAAYGDPAAAAVGPGMRRRTAWDLAAASFLADLLH